MRNSTLCYIEQNGCYLMLHRIKKSGDVNRDKWIGVGGGLEEGESPLDCVLRETAEETGLKLLDPRYRGLVTFSFGDNDGNAMTEQMHLFTCTDFTGELASDCDEGDLEWVPVERVPELPIWEGDKIFLDLLIKEPRFFLLKLVYHGDKLIEHALTIAGA